MNPSKEVATVVESKSDNFKVGDTVVGTSMEGNILAKEDQVQK
jgi:NADPH-dependent curcumin reductase CurA